MAPKPGSRRSIAFATSTKASLGTAVQQRSIRSLCHSIVWRFGGRGMSPSIAKNHLHVREAAPAVPPIAFCSSPRGCLPHGCVKVRCGFYPSVADRPILKPCCGHRGSMHTSGESYIFLSSKLVPTSFEAAGRLHEIIAKTRPAAHPPQMQWVWGTVAPLLR